MQWRPMAPRLQRNRLMASYRQPSDGQSARTDNLDNGTVPLRVGDLYVLARSRPGHDVPTSHLQGCRNTLSSGKFTRCDAVLGKHMTKLRSARRGQALLLVTLSLFAMCGLLGLAVDLGWSYFVKKSAQNAADAAALAAAYQTLNINGETITPFPPSGAPNGNCDLGGN